MLSQSFFSLLNRFVGKFQTPWTLQPSVRGCSLPKNRDVAVCNHHTFLRFTDLFYKKHLANLGADSNFVSLSDKLLELSFFLTRAVQ